jgi:hypothetical protein
VGAAVAVLALFLGNTVPRGDLPLFSCAFFERNNPLRGQSPQSLPTFNAGRSVPSHNAVEVPAVANDADEAVLGRPIALAVDADLLYIADAMDCAVKIFTKDGRFLRSVGRKGAGPGELSFPSGVAATGSSIVVADKLNFRIQTFDREGTVRGAFKVPFAPDRVFALGDERLLVTANPTGRRSGERLLHIYDAAGRIVWEGFDARASSDPIADTFRNMILVCPGARGEFRVVHRSGDRTVHTFSASGALLSKTDVDSRYASISVDLPAGKGTLRLDGFCWAAASDGELLYLSAPESVAGKDLGPGRALSVIDGQGRLRARIELPCAVHRFLVDDGRVFAVDDEGALRIFEVGR